MDPLLGEVDGARLGTELYDSYSNHFSFPLGSHSNMSRLFTRPSPPPEESTSDDQSHPPTLFPGRSGASGHRSRYAMPPSSSAGGGHAGTELLRRSSIRRREFGDWSSRRRNYARSSSIFVDQGAGSRAGRASSPGNDFPLFWTDHGDRNVTGLPMTGVSGRASRRGNSQSNVSGPDPGSDVYAGTSRLRPFHSAFSGPRLRRGGVHPPEYLFAMPSDNPPAPGRSETTDDSIPGLDIMDRLTPPPATHPWSIPTTAPSLGLPTPRSSSPEETRVAVEISRTSN